MEGEFSFADMVAQDNQIKLSASVDSKESELDPFESPVKSSGSSGGSSSYLQSQFGMISEEERIKHMIGTDCSIQLMPPQCWSASNNYTRSVGVASPFVSDSSNSLDIGAMVTSFLPCGLSLSISATTDYVCIKSIGVISFRVLFSRDSTAGSGGDEAKGTGRGAPGSPTATTTMYSTPPYKKVGVGPASQIQVMDVNVPPPKGSSSATAFSSPSDLSINDSPSHAARYTNASTTVLKTPWPSSKVEAMIMQRNLDFPVIINVSTYSSSSIRSSAASTPQTKSRPSKRGKGGL